MRYLVPLVILAGCGGGFYKNGAQPGEWERDLYECRKEASPAASNRRVYELTMDGCLALKGWHER